MYLQSLTDKQLVRLFNKLLRRIWLECEGGTMFGIDLPTLRIVSPGLYEAYILLRKEGRRRSQSRQQSSC